MKRISLVFFFICLSLFAEEPVIDLGFMEESTYTHDYFGMKLTVPKDWHVQDVESRQRLMKMGKKVISGDDENMKATEKQLKDIIKTVEFQER